MVLANPQTSVLNSIVKEQCPCPWTWGLNLIWLALLHSRALPSLVSTLHIISYFGVACKGGFQKNFWDDLFLFRSSHLPLSLEGYSLYLLPFLLLHPWSMVDPHSDAFSFAQLRFVSPQYWSRMLAITGNELKSLRDVHPGTTWLMPWYNLFIFIRFYPDFWVVQFLFTQMSCETTINYTSFLKKS